MEKILAERSDGIEVCRFHASADVEAAQDLRPRRPGIWDVGVFVRHESWDGDAPGRVRRGGAGSPVGRGR